MIWTYSARVIEYGIIKKKFNKIETRYFKEIGAHLECKGPKPPLLFFLNSFTNPPTQSATNPPKLDPGWTSTHIDTLTFLSVSSSRCIHTCHVKDSSIKSPNTKLVI